MIKKLIFTALTVILLTSCVTADKAKPSADDVSQIKARLDSHFTEFVGAEITVSPVKPLYEIKVDNTTLYTIDGDQIIAGLIYDKDKRLITPVYQRSLVPNRVEPAQVQKADLGFLDLSTAVKVGSGSHTVIEFTDVECPYCKRAEAFFEANATRYIFFIALDFHPNAKPQAIHILCSGDKAEAYKAIMQGNIPNTLLDCEEGRKLFELHKSYAERLAITGTPMFYVDGVLVEGADPAIVNMLK